MAKYITCGNSDKNEQLNITCGNSDKNEQLNITCGNSDKNESNNHMVKYILFNNGIFNLNTREFFTKINLQAEQKQKGDCLKLNCNYLQEFSKNHKDILEVQEFLQNIFLTDVCYQQFMNKYSEILKGNLKNENHMWMGEEKSGKTTLLQFFQKLFKFYRGFAFCDKGDLIYLIFDKNFAFVENAKKVGQLRYSFNLYFKNTFESDNKFQNKIIRLLPALVWVLLEWKK